MVNKKLFVATFIGLVILSIIGSTGAFAQTQMATTAATAKAAATANATAAAATASATTSGGFLGLPGFEGG
jgi:hypothetical protein